MKHIFRTSGIPLVLIPFLVVSPIWAQSFPAVAESSSQAASLELRVVEEPKGIPTAGFIPPKRMTVQVRDETGRPVSDAAVAFRLPDTSLSGSFADGTQSAVAYTDGSGVAHVDGIRWIASSGSVLVRITATKGNSHAGLLFEERMSAAVAPEPAPVARGEEARATPSVSSYPRMAPFPGVTASEAGASSAPAEVAAVMPPARPSVSISSFTKS